MDLKKCLLLLLTCIRLALAYRNAAGRKSLGGAVELASSDAAAFLGPHNAARAQVNQASLTWDPVLESYAQRYAAQKQASNNCGLQHSGGRYGENIFWGSAGGTWSPEDATSSWIGEKQSYNYQTNSCDAAKQCGHYTQIVWKTTTRMGCASVKCAKGDVFMICNYDPPGNIVGQRPY